MSNFRKQFQRVRQNIDQNLGRAEKTEILSEEEQGLERRVELIRNISSALLKKLLLCLRSSPQAADLDRRMKKLPESGLSHTLIESSVQLEQNSPSGQVFKMVGELQGQLSQELLTHDLNVEASTIKLLSNTIEVDYPAIQKLKKQLNSRTLDMDAAKSRYQSSIKQLQSGAMFQSKVDEARVDYEDAVARLEQTKDQWATEMYNFSSKELELNQALLELLKYQADLFKKSADAIEGIVPRIQECLDFSTQKAVFGQELEEHVKLRNNRSISRVIEECVLYLLNHGMDEEGLFRIAGSSSKIKKLKSAFNSNILNGNVLDCVEDVDVHVVASVLKLYLRELPEALLRSELFEEWKGALRQEKPAEALKEVADKMPKVYYDNLRYLVKFFSSLAEHSDCTKMTPSNLGLVLGPNLITPAIAQPEMAVLSIQSNLAESLITHANTIFPGDFSFSEGSTPPATHHAFTVMPAHPFTTIPTNKPPQTTVLPSFFNQSSALHNNFKADFE